MYLQLYPLGLNEEINFDTAIDNFKLYLGLTYLIELMKNELFVLIFWIHFLSLSLFLGHWISKDALKYNMHKSIVFFPLVLTYFTGPVGLCFYLLLRLLVVQKFKLHVSKIKKLIFTSMLVVRTVFSSYPSKKV